MPETYIREKADSVNIFTGLYAADRTRYDVNSGARQRAFEILYNGDMLP
jgi:hypothetical protein